MLLEPTDREFLGSCAVLLPVAEAETTMALAVLAEGSSSQLPGTPVSLEVKPQGSGVLLETLRPSAAARPGPSDCCLHHMLTCA